MRKLALFILCVFAAPLLSACVLTPPPRNTETPISSIPPTATQETFPPSAPLSATPELFPEFSSDAVQPLLYRIGVALSREYVTDFDAARGLDADRYFTDALLYEFLNSDLYDKSVQVGYDEQTYSCVIKAEDMLYLLRQYIGDYPALIQPPADIFISLNESGDYVYGRSDMGLTEYEIEVKDIAHPGGGTVVISAALYQIDLDEDADMPIVHVNDYTLCFARADDSAYGYTIARCSVDVS